MGNELTEKLLDLFSNPGFDGLSADQQDALVQGLVSLRPRGGRVLIVDARPESAELCWRVLKELGYTACYACDERSALAALREMRPELLVLGMTGSGLEALGWLGRLRAEPKAAASKVIVTGTATMHWEQARRAGAQDFWRFRLI